MIAVPGFALAPAIPFDGGAFFGQATHALSVLRTKVTTLTLQDMKMPFHTMTCDFALGTPKNQ
jgi:hypothetical protein